MGGKGSGQKRKLNDVQEFRLGFLCETEWQRVCEERKDEHLEKWTGGDRTKRAQKKNLEACVIARDELEDLVQGKETHQAEPASMGRVVTFSKRIDEHKTGHIFVPAPGMVRQPLMRLRSCASAALSGVISAPLIRMCATRSPTRGGTLGKGRANRC